jgi:sulfonate transport system substrate-binding protein
LGGSRKFRAWLMLCGVLMGAPVCGSAGAEPRTLRIGYQKYGTLVYEKARGTLEKRLAPLAYPATRRRFSRRRPA